MVTNSLVLSEKIVFAIFLTVNLPNLGHPQFCIKNEIYKLKDGMLFAYLQAILPNGFDFTKH